MGLFCLATKGTIDDDIESAILNLKLFLQNRGCEYLLDFAENQISDAKKRLGEPDE